ncbi:hypothetical protein DICVIV_11873 [Dictyocaulus viviparus]|uniref:SAP domain-containing protein n=1 Tax=Dictyocaulus viviparus TaxID=29172 RepID=A0A0D8XEF9_DICVI|nr:hypothetical protein DICVIV_11873 [Dictyocaulus viviparus]
MVEAIHDELNDYCSKLKKISDDFTNKCKVPPCCFRYDEEGSAKIGRNIPAENNLKQVEYEEPPKGIVTEILMDVKRRLHSLTVSEMRSLLKKVHQSGQGSRKQLRARIRRYYRKEFSMYRMLHEGDCVPHFGNKTARYFDYLVAIDFECTCVEVIYDYPHEIIEFPAVLIDVRHLKIVSVFI